MKVIIDITKEGLMYAKMLSMCGMADEFHEAIAEGIPVIDGSELASLLIDMRISGDIHDTTFIVLRKGNNYSNEVIVKRYKAGEVSRCPECGSTIKKAESEEV